MAWVHRNLGLTALYKPKLSSFGTAAFGMFPLMHVPIEITVSLYGTVDKQREMPFFIPGSRCAIHTLISPDVDIFAPSTALSHPGFVSDDVKVFKRGFQVICIYGAICVVSASSSPVSRVISKPKEVGSFDELGLPVPGIAIDSSVVIVKHEVFL